MSAFGIGFLVFSVQLYLVSRAQKHYSDWYYGRSENEEQLTDSDIESVFESIPRYRIVEISTSEYNQKCNRFIRRPEPSYMVYKTIDGQTDAEYVFQTFSSVWKISHGDERKHLIIYTFESMSDVTKLVEADSEFKYTDLIEIGFVKFVRST